MRLYKLKNRKTGQNWTKQDFFRRICAGPGRLVWAYAAAILVSCGGVDGVSQADACRDRDPAQFLRTVCNSNALALATGAGAPDPDELLTVCLAALYAEQECAAEDARSL
jgi:hypothetical protein